MDQDTVEISISPTAANLGTTTLTLKIIQDQVEQQANFALDVTDPCSSAYILDAPDSVVSDFHAVLPLTSLSHSQSFVIKTSLSQQYPALVCPL